MKNIDKNLVLPSALIKDAIETIEYSDAEIALVCDPERHLLGTVTDGDIRRAFLKGATLTDNVKVAMNENPVTASIDDDRSPLIDMMRRNILRHVPILNSDRQVVSLETLQALLECKKQNNPVLLMAGGFGTRLHPLTEDCPKPMLTVGDKPILETIIVNLRSQGFHSFFISVNYLGQMIQDHFGDGSDYGINIKYLMEEEPLGTAGPLSLLPEKPKTPLIVMNGDILTKVNLRHLLNFHEEHHSSATMCARNYSVEVPFGVIEIDHHRIHDIVEKPTQSFLVNAGIYVLNPDVVSKVKNIKKIDMTDLFKQLIDEGMDTSVFPIREYWLDVGRIDDLNQASGEFLKEFPGHNDEPAESG